MEHKKENNSIECSNGKNKNNLNEEQQNDQLGCSCCKHKNKLRIKREVLDRIILILVSIIGILAMYYMILSLFDIDEFLLNFLGNQWTEFSLATIVFLMIGITFIKNSTKSLMEKKVSTDTLVSLATSSAYIYSVFAIIFNITTDNSLPFFFYETIEVLWLIYLGRVLEDWLKSKVTKEIDSLDSLKPKKAILIMGKKEIEIDTKEVKIGDILLVKTGEIIPVDGKVVNGKTTIDESSLTGESNPIEKSVGSDVYGGTISLIGTIRIKVTKLIDDSFISKIIDSVKEAARTKPQTQKIADKISSFLVPIILVIGAISFLVNGLVFTFWADVPNSFINLTNGSEISKNSLSWLYAFYILISILIIACPCSFALITPMSVLAASSISKKSGFIFSSKNIFETIKDIDVVCFDKTGTLTEGKFSLKKQTITNEKILKKVVSAEKHSNHPIANSITREFKNYPINDSDEIKEIIGKGIKINNELYVGSLSWLKEIHNDFVEDENDKQKRLNGTTFVYVFDKNKKIGHFELEDSLKEGVLETIWKIKQMGIKVMMITGDQKDVAIKIGKKIGLTNENEIFSEVTPNEKSNIIKELEKSGKRVAFVGDGINDIIALSQADIGISFGESSDAAMDVADIILKNNDLSLIPYVFWLSKRTLRTVNRGFIIAITYNVIASFLAATGIISLTGLGPTISALSMMFNDTVAMFNALTLKKASRKKFLKKNKFK